MDKNVLKYLPLTTVLMALLFICGGLYLVGFWSTFKIDPFNLMEIWDIPKSFIMPFVISNVIILFSMAVIAMSGMRFNYSIIRRTKKTKYQIFWTETIPATFSSEVLILIAMVIMLSFYAKFGSTKNYWYIMSYIFSTLIVYQINKVSFVRKYLYSKNLRIFLIMSLVYIPFTCFVLGKTISLDIYSNTEIRYINVRSADAARTSIDTISSFKLLGFLGKKLIIGSLDNNKVFVINQDSYSMIDVTDKRYLVLPNNAKGSVTKNPHDTITVKK